MNVVYLRKRKRPEGSGDGTIGIEDWDKLAAVALGLPPLTGFGDRPLG